MAKIIIFNKPFNVLSQFTDSEGRQTLADYIKQKGIYAAGRLDRDSEGLMVLTDNGAVQHQIANPKNKMAKTYWAQVEGVPDEIALEKLKKGVELKDGMTKPAEAKLIEPTNIWPRNPPIRYRTNIPTTWIALTIKEGKNRQVRRMTAAVGHPTLRLIRTQIGPWTLDGLEPGQWQEVECPLKLLQATPKSKQTRNKKPRTDTSIRPHRK